MSLIRSNKSCIGWGLEKIERDAPILSWRNQAVTLIDEGHERGFEGYGDVSPTMPLALVLLSRGKREQRPTDLDQLKEALISATKRLDLSLRLYHATQELHPPRGDSHFVPADC